MNKIRDKVVYYFGAGASANAIPVLESLRPNILKSADFLKCISVVAGSLENIRYDRVKGEMIEDLEWLYSESGQHKTVDTLAKRFSLQGKVGEQNLKRLKHTLCLYFSIEHFVDLESKIFENEKFQYKISPKLDLRYDTFLASIAEKAEGVKLDLNSDIGCISWNYDLQLELALMRYVNTNINHTRKFHQVVPNFDSISRGARVNISEFICVKLNGSALMYPYPEPKDDYKVSFYDYSYSDNENVLTELVNNLIENYKVFKDKTSPIEFAWEHDKKSTDKLKWSKELMSRAKTIVIIGYSFPYFNRSIDQHLFSDTNPAKIIIQDKNPEAIRDRVINLFQKCNQELSPVISDRISFESPDNYFYVED